MNTIQVPHLNLKYTLECGQIFRFQLLDGWYYVHSRDKVFRIRQCGDVLEFAGVSEKFLRRFFRLDDDLCSILRSIDADPYICQAIRKYRGLRLIRQDPWECLVSYLCSAASNIPKIQGNIEGLARRFGKPVRLGKLDTFTFPDPGDIDRLSCIRGAGTGFRAANIKAANDAVRKGFLRGLSSLDYDEAKRRLIELPGIGHKVADCVLLFSLDHMRAFPVDVWIGRIMRDLYFRGERVSDDEIRAFALEYFGKYAGYAQQYLYYYARKGEAEIS